MHMAMVDHNSKQKESKERVNKVWAVLNKYLVAKETLIKGHL